MVYISFITSVKICKGYEELLQKVHTYIQNIEHFCNKLNISYEILICEQVDYKNIQMIDISYVNTKVIKLRQKYPNPFDFNMIESYGKNECLKVAKGIYCCMTSADVIFSENFFHFIKYKLVKETFYRFATFEIDFFDAKNNSVREVIRLCENDKTKTLCNPGCFEPPLDFAKLGQKSGDIMVLDTESFRKIRGWPQTECYHHMDTVVCMVASNVYNIMVPPENVCIYTMRQTRTGSGDYNSRKAPPWAVKWMYSVKPDLDHELTLNTYQWLRALQYMNNTTCN